MTFSFPRESAESERALLEYYAGMRTRRFELDTNHEGFRTFSNRNGSEAKDLPAEATWRLIWEGKKLCEGRPKEMSRHFQQISANGAGE
jgi:hypothetical protein